MRIVHAETQRAEAAEIGRKPAQTHHQAVVIGPSDIRERIHIAERIWLHPWLRIEKPRGRAENEWILIVEPGQLVRIAADVVDFDHRIPH